MSLYELAYTRTDGTRVEIIAATGITLHRYENGHHAETQVCPDLSTAIEIARQWADGEIPEAP